MSKQLHVYITTHIHILYVFIYTYTVVSKVTVTPLQRYITSYFAVTSNCSVKRSPYFARSCQFNLQIQFNCCLALKLVFCFSRDSISLKEKNE
jgi:hypothetical protein